MTTTKHQQLNSLVDQIHQDAAHIKQTAGCSAWFGMDELKLMRDRAHGILNKIDTYLELLK